jgi:sorting nexin-8
MSLFGSSPPADSPSLGNSTIGRSRNSLFDEDGPMTRSTSDTLFDDNDMAASGTAPWSMPTPRKQQSRADLIRSLLSGTDVPDTYIEAFDHALREDGSGGKVTSAGVSKTLAAAELAADNQSDIMKIIAPGDQESELGRDAFNVLLALIGLAQEGETLSLDAVDERRHSKFATPYRFPQTCPAHGGIRVSFSIVIRQLSWRSTYDGALS